MLLPIINNSPILKEIEPLSKNLSDLAGTGLEALKFIESKNNADTGWLNKANSVLKKSLTPYGKVQIAIINGIKKMIEAAGQKTNQYPEIFFTENYAS